MEKSKISVVRQRQIIPKHYRIIDAIRHINAIKQRLRMPILDSCRIALLYINPQAIKKLGGLRSRKSLGKLACDTRLSKSVLLGLLVLVFRGIVMKVELRVRRLWPVEVLLERLLAVRAVDTLLVAVKSSHVTQGIKSHLWYVLLRDNRSVLILKHGASCRRIKLGGGDTGFAEDAHQLLCYYSGVLVGGTVGKSNSRHASEWILEVGDEVVQVEWERGRRTGWLRSTVLTDILQFVHSGYLVFFQNLLNFIVRKGFLLSIRSVYENLFCDEET